MNKSTYRTFRATSRANGFSYARRTCGLGLYELGLLAKLETQEPDDLEFRAHWMKNRTESRGVVIRTTSPLLAHKKVLTD